MLHLAVSTRKAWAEQAPTVLADTDLTAVHYCSRTDRAASSVRLGESLARLFGVRGF